MTDIWHDSVSLSSLSWRFAGYLGEDWRFRNAFVTDEPSRPWFDGSVPGSVHWDLLRAGQLDDPYHGLQSLSAEWVSQRQWVYRTTIEIPQAWDERRVFLVFDGTDYTADVFLDGRLLGTSTSLFAPSTYEITGASGPMVLSVVLREAPPEQSQIGHSSKVRTHKPRMSYGWDFAPRLVHLGIWGDVRLESSGPARLSDVWVRPALSADLKSAAVEVQVELADAAPKGTTVQVDFHHDGHSICRADVEVAPGALDATAALHMDDIALWWPNGMGAQALYECCVTVNVGDQESDHRRTPFGLRTVRLVPNDADAGPRTDALPYTLEVNGERIYAKGWNWVPVDAMFGRPDLSERYAHLIELARDAHVNLLRVWGGGPIERTLFYDLCDRAGLLVWQEFVQSSSGLDNEPPVDSEYLGSLVHEAAAIVRSRRGHPSLALWCGGNELADVDGPVALTHPNIDALHGVIKTLDPDRPFLPSSPSGPVFFLERSPIDERPLDLHDVHGPWDYRGPVESYALYDASTALLHSEFGTPGAISKSSLNNFMSSDEQWPPDETNPPWVHHGAWWLQRGWIERVFGEVKNIDDYIDLSQWMQADLLAYALDANRRRWPTCSGSLPWQLNEPWPNAHCTSAVDYYLRPKPAYWGVRAAYAPISASLRHGGIALGGPQLSASVHVTSDRSARAEVKVSCHRLDGSAVSSSVLAFEGSGSIELGRLDLDLEAAGCDVVVVRLELQEADAVPASRRHYVFSRHAGDEVSFRSFYEMERTEVRVEVSPGRLILRNAGAAIAPFPIVDVDDESVLWHLSDNTPLLLPGESSEIEVTARPRTQPVGPHAPLVPPRTSDVDGVEVTVHGWNFPTERAMVPILAR